MSRHTGRLEYALCDGRGDGHRCPAFVVPAPHGDPAGRGHVFGGYLDVTVAGGAAGWLMDGDHTLCPEHLPIPNKEN